MPIPREVTPGYHREFTYDMKGNPTGYTDKLSGAFGGGCLLPILLVLLAALMVA